MKEEEDESAMRPMARHEYTTEPPYRPVSYQLIRGLGRGGGEAGRVRGGAGEGEEELVKEEEEDWVWRGCSVGRDRIQPWQAGREEGDREWLHPQ